MHNLTHAQTVCTRLSFPPPPFREPGYKANTGGNPKGLTAHPLMCRNAQKVWSYQDLIEVWNDHTTCGHTSCISVPPVVIIHPVSLYHLWSYILYLCTTCGHASCISVPPVVIHPVSLYHLWSCILYLCTTCGHYTSCSIFK